jgi:hypothetical protein
MDVRRVKTGIVTRVIRGILVEGIMGRDKATTLVIIGSRKGSNRGIRNRIAPPSATNARAAMSVTIGDEVGTQRNVNVLMGMSMVVSCRRPRPRSFPLEKV